MRSVPGISQVAISVRDRAQSRGFYEKLGFVYTGSMGPVKGEVPSRLLELSEIEATIDWMVGRDPMNQFELIEFRRPIPRPLPSDWSMLCEGYSALGIVVPDFQAMLQLLVLTGTQRWITGSAPNRSAWLRDPNGVLVEILERDPLGLLPAASGSEGLASLRTVSLTVRNAKRALERWVEGLGFMGSSQGHFSWNPWPPEFAPSASDCDEEVIHGGSMLVRFMQPKDGAVRQRAQSYRLSDLGILNIAVILESVDAFHSRCAHLEARGFRFSTTEAMIPGEDAGTRYGYDDQGNSVEIGFVIPGSEEKYGWRR